MSYSLLLPIPMLYIISNLVGYNGTFYSLEYHFHVGHLTIAAILLFISGTLSHLSFARIVNNLYPILDVMGTVFILVIFTIVGEKNNI